MRRSTIARLLHGLRDPRKIAHFLRHNLMDPLRYRTSGGYDSERYWRDRHSRFGLDLRGVGIEGISDAENRAMYDKARAVFLDLCRESGIDFTSCRVLDIGCGTGFYATILRDQGVTEYTGIDITDTLFHQLSGQFPGFLFKKIDVTAVPIDAKYNLILMIDVTQHITEPNRFSYAMANIRNSITENGLFIVTSWLDRNARESFYEVSRGVEDYRREFPASVFSEPRSFRDKKIFSIRGDQPLERG